MSYLDMCVVSRNMDIDDYSPGTVHCPFRLDWTPQTRSSPGEITSSATATRRPLYVRRALNPEPYPYCRVPNFGFYLWIKPLCQQGVLRPPGKNTFGFIIEAFLDELVVALTAFDPEEVARSGVGFDGVFDKPVDVPKLLSFLDSAVDAREAPSAPALAEHWAGRAAEGERALAAALREIPGLAAKIKTRSTRMTPRPSSRPRGPWAPFSGG